MSDLLITFLTGPIAIMAAIAAGPALSATSESSEAARVAATYDHGTAALMRGDAAAWAKSVPLTDDFLLFSPFGGEPSRFADYTPDKIARMGRFFRNGRHVQEVLEVYSSDDLIVLAAIERDNVEVGGLPRQDWALRVTSVFRREGGHWKLAHRHADPFVVDVPLAQAARIARGERDEATR